MSFNVVDDYTQPTLFLPALFLQVNPESMTIKYAKKVSRAITIDADVEFHWTDELDTISCSGSTGAFVHEDIGLTNLHKTETKAYLNFKDLIDLYRNNGCVYSDTGRLIQKGYVILNYDESVYLGIFESFTYSEDASTPFRNRYDFIFKVEQTIINL